MKIVIVGCGRVGATLAGDLDGRGHEVIVIDQVTSAFDRLPATFGGQAIRADGTDEDSLLRAGAGTADVFLALTEGDNRNVMAAQLAAEALGIEQVVAKINDPVRAEAYAALGIATICRTELMDRALLESMGLPPGDQPGYRAAAPHEHPMTERPASAPVPASTARAATATGREG